MDLNVSVTESGDTLAVSFTGPLDETQAIALSDRILNLCPAEIPARVEVDLSNCPQVCNQGFGALVSFRLSPEIAKCSASIKGLNGAMEQRLKILKLDRLFDIQKQEAKTKSAAN